jgi:hypothetical protein
MEWPTYPAYSITAYSTLLKKDVTFPVIVPDYVLPMDLYNVLFMMAMTPTSARHGWITNKSRYVTSEEAAALALEANRLDKKVAQLSTTEYTGSWKAPK